MKTKSSISGFTLIEIAIVLLVVTILLGYTVAMFPIQQDLKKYRDVNAEMNAIIDSLIGYAQVNGRLPCPDTDSDGLANSVDNFNNDSGAAGADGREDSCTGFFGFLPSGTLGMNGNINDQGQLIDPWGAAYGYAVSASDSSGNGIIDLVSPNEIRNEGIANVIDPALQPPDLFVCDGSPATGDDLNCADAASNPIVSNVAVVIISLGKDSDSTTGASNIQQENTDDFFDGTNDKVYVSSTRSSVANAEYDDVVKWISPNLLFSKMIEADQLP